jgi:hypothetical protein
MLNHPVEKHLVGLIERHLATGLFWFSYTWDLTNRVQAQSVSENEPLWKRADDRFFWNKHLQSKFIELTQDNLEQDLGSFILPLVYGSFDLRPTIINRTPFNLVLISRRCRYRAGTRYFTRGIDSFGHVANFNETEQLILLDDPSDERTVPGQLSGADGVQLGFVQTRGSIPLFWAEVNNLRYKPDLQIMDTEDTLNALQLHLTEQLNIYGPTTLVNLVKQTGYEGPIKKAFEDRLDELKMADVGYEYFNFAKECKNMKWDRISLLIDRLDEIMEQGGYFHQVASNPAPLKRQTAVLRTNCMDCLDRTNVVQSAIAKRVLTKQLRALDILAEDETLEAHEDFMHTFRNIWADHADAVSTAYSGTGALKTDFTRTGKRSKEGLMQDGLNSITRYLKNNYFDGERQDAFDLFTGAWVPRRGPSTAMSLVVDNRSLTIRSMPFISMFALFMVIAGMILPRTSEWSLYYYHIFWFLLFVSSLSYILAHGVEYVAWPRLNPPVESIYYDGPGYRSGQNGKGLWVPKLVQTVLARMKLEAGASVVGRTHGRALSRTDAIEMGAFRKEE